MQYAFYNNLSQVYYDRFVHRKHIVLLIAFTLGCWYVIATVGCCLLAQVYGFNESLHDFFFFCKVKISTSQMICILCP